MEMIVVLLGLPRPVHLPTIGVGASECLLFEGARDAQDSQSATICHTKSFGRPFPIGCEVLHTFDACPRPDVLPPVLFG